MNIRILTLATFPDGHAATSRIRCYSKALRDQGHNVQVVAPRNMEVLPGRRWFYCGETEDIRFVLLDNLGMRSSRWLRYLHAYVEPILLLLYLVFTFRKGNVFIIYGDKVWSRLLMLLILKAARKRVILELNEYPFATEGSRLSRLPGVGPTLRFFVFHMIFPLANGFIVISKALESIATAHAPRAELLLVPILAEYPPMSSMQKVESKNPYIFHAGSLSEQKDGIYVVFEAFVMAHLSLRKNYGIQLKFYLTNKVTQTSTWERIEHLLACNGLQEQVVITGFRAETELRKFLSGSIALVINKPHGLQNYYNFPTKTAAYLSSGRPVILAAQDLEVNRYLMDNENAVVVRPDDSASIAAAVVKCFVEPNYASRIGKSGAETAERNFYYSIHAQRISEFVCKQ